MPQSQLYKPTIFLRGLAMAGAFFFLGLYLFTAINRLSYPFEIEWQEGEVLNHVGRVLSGEPLYVAPSLDFIPFIYTPLYYYACAAIAKITGPTLMSLRLVSFLSSLGCFFAIYLFVKRESGDRECGIFAASLFAATFVLGSAWFDIARVDSFFLLLVLFTAYILRFHATNTGLAGAGILLGLAFLAKQAALFVALPMIAYTAIASRGARRLIFGGVFSAVVAGSTLAFDLASEGWYTFYIFKAPSGHAIDFLMLFKFWAEDVARPMAIALCLTFFCLADLWSKSRRSLFFYAMLFLGTVGSSWFSRLHTGGYPNVLMPTYAMLAIGAGLGISMILAFANKLQADDMQETVWYSGRPAMAALYLSICVQFLSLAYNPYDYLPTAQDSEAGRRLVTAIEKIDGEVFIHGHGYLAVAAGKKGHAHAMAWFDVIRSGEGKLQQGAVFELVDAISKKRFAAIVGDQYSAEFPPPPYWEAVENNYTYAGPLLEDSFVFWTKAGFKTRPQHLYLPSPGEPQDNNAEAPPSPLPADSQ